MTSMKQVFGAKPLVAPERIPGGLPMGTEPVRYSSTKVQLTHAAVVT